MAIFHSYVNSPEGSPVLKPFRTPHLNGAGTEVAIAGVVRGSEPLVVWTQSQARRSWNFEAICQDDVIYGSKN